MIFDGSDCGPHRLFYWFFLTWQLLLLLGVGGCTARPEQELPARVETRFDVVISARYVVTMDADENVYEPGFVGVQGDTIIEVGRWDPVLAREARTVVEAPRSLILPGLINGHQHAPMSLLRGIADDRELMSWLQDYIFPAEARNVDPDLVYWGTMLSTAEMISRGTTTFADMYYYEEEVAKAVANAGMRGILGQTIIDFPAPDYETPERAVEGARRFILDWRNHPLVIPAIAPHAPYTCSPAVLIKCKQLADELDAPLLIHLAETEAEVEQLLEAQGIRPIQFLEQIGFLSDRVIAAHVVWANRTEIDLLRLRKVGVIHNPESNMKLASGVAPITEMLNAGVEVGLGTDGPASNNNLDLFQEMDSMAKLHKISRMEPTAITARDALSAATSGGARALNLGDRVGSFEPGKKADLIVVNLEVPSAIPQYDLYSMLVYALDGAAVTDVMVDGRWLMRDRLLLTLDLDEISRQAVRIQSRIRESLRQ